MVVERTANLVQRGYDGFETRAFLAQGLGSFGIIPDVRVFQLPVDLFEALFLVFIVKDTPSARNCADEDLRFAESGG